MQAIDIDYEKEDVFLEKPHRNEDIILITKKKLIQAIESRTHYISISAKSCGNEL